MFMFVIGGVLWLIFAMLVSTYAKSKGRSFVLFFILSIVLSPLLAFIIALIVSDEKKAKKQHDEMLAAMNGTGVKTSAVNTVQNDEYGFSSIDMVDANTIVMKNIEENTYDKIKVLLEQDILNKGFEKKVEVNTATKYGNNKGGNIQVSINKKELTISFKNTGIPAAVYQLIEPKVEEKVKQEDTTIAIDAIEQLTKLAALLEKGLLTEEEFTQQKQAVLAKA